ncbi:carbohydrate porin [Pedobacter sp. HMWF019]|nr:carbohydrate porin [Pedobacter sp. HMWF019]
MKKISTIGILLLSAHMAWAQKADTVKQSNWSYHFQFTAISQYHAAFKAPYQGRNSLADTAEIAATSVTSTMFLGRKLWKGAALYFNPEISGGRGLSSAVGVAGALNGETYRVGNAAPAIFIARAYFQQQFALGNTEYEYVADDVNQVGGMVPKDRITITAGKFAASDFYDDNKYSHDPRSQFFNWALMGNGAWDYPANTRGYTMGLVVEFVKADWAFRLSSVAVPRIANAPKLEYKIDKAHSETLEIERKNLFKRPGSLRLLLTNTYSRAPSYAQGIQALADNNTQILNVISGQAEGTTYGGRKYGFGFSGDQELTDDLGIFARAGWNDGKDVTWAFTEIDRTASLGLSLKGVKWKRADDVFGLAAVVNGLSDGHRTFIADGGYGFIIGDGKLNYGKEMILETYYNAKLTKTFWLTADYQFVNHPAYNKDRGPVNVFAIRGHIEF